MPPSQTTLATFVATLTVVWHLAFPALCMDLNGGSETMKSDPAEMELNIEDIVNIHNPTESRKVYRRSLDDDCDPFIADDRYLKDSVYLEIPPIGTDKLASTKKLTEIHIRHNLKGNVILQDSPDNFLRVEVEKSAGKQVELSYISQQAALSDTGKGQVLMVQVDYQEKTTSLLTIIGGVAAVLVLFSLIILVIWLYHKRHMEEAPVTTARSRQGSPSSQGHPSPSRKATSRGGSAATSPRRSGDVNSPRQRNRAAPGERTGKTSESTQPLALPPPPRPHQRQGSDEMKKEAGAAGSRQAGVGSPRGLYRSTMVTFTVLSLVTLACGALCTLQPKADIVIKIPRGFDYGSINVFFNKKFKGHLDMEHWVMRNATYKNILVFDIDDARPSENTMCFAKDLCSGAHQQGLAGCNVAKQQCICSRGYKRDRDLCHDINECREDASACPPGIQCTNTVGSHICNCPLGYFYTRGRCKRCSAVCPEGHYEAAQCSATQNRICKACTKCGKGRYSIQPCGGNSDNKCLHAAHPVLISKDETFPQFVHGLHSNWSDNVFIENLHNTRDLETIFYATAASEQLYDFWWVRESNVKVNIGLEKVNIFPKFKDVTHTKSDNYYMRGSNRDVSHIDTEWFKRVTRSYCRHPIPEFYKITLEVATDRMTNATEHQCGSKQYSCQAKVTDFEHNSYIERSLNTGCSRYSTFPTTLSKHTNNVVCVEGAGDMLGQVFGLREKPVKPIKKYPKSCNNVIEQCQGCLDSSRCRHADNSIDRACCQESCYSHKNCKDTFNRTCRQSKVDCAMGDAYSFTLEPQFHTTDTIQMNHPTFQCHIEQDKPEVLYKLWFYVSIPEIKFDLPKVFHEVYPGDVQSISWGTYQVEFIDLEHNTIIDLEDDLMLVGQEFSKDNVSFTIYPLKKPEEYTRNGYEVNDVGGGNNYVTKVQFNDIFGYSTSSWSDKDCHKDMGRFCSVQPHYKNKPQKVNAITEAVGYPYKYYLKNAEGKDPFLKFSTPANTSVLKWWFRNKSPALIMDESLEVKLHLHQDDKLWNISLKGAMTECPGYLAVTINDRDEGAEFFKYDIIVRCDANKQAKFNATFKIPQFFGLKTDKTFDVILDDAKTEYRVFLTHFVVHNAETKKIEKVVIPLSDSRAGFPVLLLCIVSVALVLIFCVSFCLYLAITQKKECLPVQDDTHYYDTLADPNQRAKVAQKKHRHPPKSLGCCTILHHMTTSRMMVVIMYITFKVIYSFAFTFSVFFTILVLLIQGHLEMITQVDVVQLRHHNQSARLQGDVELHVQSEVRRQVGQARNMQNACQGYLDDIILALSDDVDNHTDSEHLREFFSMDTSITTMFRHKYQQIVESYYQDLDRYQQEYEGTFNRSFSYYFKHYMAYLDRAMYSNPWFMQWADYFNQSNTESYNQIRGAIHGPAVEFAEYADLQDALKVKLWPVQFWEKFESSPVAPDINLWTFSQLQCEATSLKKLMADTSSTTDSVLFMYPSSQQPETLFSDRLQSTFSVQEFLENLNLGILRLVFFSMDLMLLFYRFTNLYLAVRSLCLGFEEHIHLNMEDIKLQGQALVSESIDISRNKRYTTQYIPLHETYVKVPVKTQGQGHDTDDLTQISDQDTLSSTGMPLDNHKQSKPAKHKPNGNIIHMPPTNGGTTSAIPKDHDKSSTHHTKFILSNGVQTIKTCLRVLLEGTLLPKFVFGTAILLLTSIIINVAQNFVTVDNILTLTCFVPDIAGLRWHIDSANSYLNTLATQVSTAAFSWYEGHMTSELKQLAALQEYFNREQERRTESYVTEACNIRGVFYSNGSCNVHRHPPQISIPMMPCNFVPIQPLLYRGHDLAILEDSIDEHYTPIISSAQAILLYVIYGALIVSSLMLIAHAIGVLIMYYFKVKEVFPTRLIFVVPSMVDPSLLCGSAGSTLREGTVLLSSGYAPDTSVPGQYDTSFETEEMEIDMDNSTVTAIDTPNTSQFSVPRFDPVQHARTVQFKDMPSLDDSDGGSKTLPLQTSSPRIIPKTASQTLKPSKTTSPSSSQGKRSNPQALTDMGYSETKV